MGVHSKGLVQHGLLVIAEFRMVVDWSQLRTVDDIMMSEYRPLWFGGE